MVLLVFWRGEIAREDVACAAMNNETGCNGR